VDDTRTIGHDSSGRNAMDVDVGDRITVRGHRVGDHDRHGEILEVRHGAGDGEPSYRVRWDDDGHESILYPGNDVEIKHFDDRH
jgi:hypothetical protein